MRIWTIYWMSSLGCFLLLEAVRRFRAREGGIDRFLSCRGGGVGEKKAGRIYDFYSPILIQGGGFFFFGPPLGRLCSRVLCHLKKGRARSTLELVQRPWRLRAENLVLSVFFHQYGIRKVSSYRANGTGFAFLFTVIPPWQKFERFFFCSSTVMNVF